MESPVEQTLLTELETRQQEVLDQLDELNERIETVLKDWAQPQTEPLPQEVRRAA